MSAIGYTPHPNPAPPRSSPPKFGRDKMTSADICGIAIPMIYAIPEPDSFDPIRRLNSRLVWLRLTRPQTPAERVVEAAREYERRPGAQTEAVLFEALSHLGGSRGSRRRSESWAAMLAVAPKDARHDD